MLYLWSRSHYRDAKKLGFIMKRATHLLQLSIFTFSSLLTAASFLGICFLFFTTYPASELPSKLFEVFTSLGCLFYWVLFSGYCLRLYLLWNSRIPNVLGIFMWFVVAVYLTPTFAFNEPILQQTRWAANPEFQQLYSF